MRLFGLTIYRLRNFCLQAFSFPVFTRPFAPTIGRSRSFYLLAFSFHASVRPFGHVIYKCRSYSSWLFCFAASGRLFGPIIYKCRSFYSLASMQLFECGAFADSSEKLAQTFHLPTKTSNNYQLSHYTRTRKEDPGKLRHLQLCI